MTLRSVSENADTNGSASSADLRFGAQGELRHVHLEGGVEMQTESETSSGSNGQVSPARVVRTWRSPVADLDFRDVGQGQVEPATIRGSGGVVVTSETALAGAAPAPSRMAADEVTGEFGPAATLKALTGTGHASIEDTSANRRTANRDRRPPAGVFCCASCRARCGSRIRTSCRP